MKKLIREFMMDCPMCDKVHMIKEYEDITTDIIKDEAITYKEKYYYCENASDEENIFVDGELLNENLLNGRNEYRKKHGLLTSYEIADIRKEYGLSQVDFARLLGWGDVTVARYETKAIQDEPYDMILRRVKDDAYFAAELLQKNIDKFTDEKVKKIKINIEAKSLKEEEPKKRESLKKMYTKFTSLSIFNGFKLLDFNKLEAAVSYIAKRVPNLYKVKLMKMLWYTDMLNYREQNSSMTGLVYKHEPMGALPIGHYEMLALPNIKVEEIDSYDYTSYKIQPNDNVNCDILSDNEKAILDKVIKKFKNYTSKEIVEYMHQETAYTKTVSGEVIPYSFVKELKRF